MEQENVIQPLETFKIVCSLYPEIFDLDKSICKNYFRQYGKVMRLIFKPKQRVIVVEYTNKNDYLNALSGSSEYEGQQFKVEALESGPSPSPRASTDSAAPKKKVREKFVKKHKLTYINPEEASKRHVSYIDNDEVNEELAAMGGYSNVKGVVDLTSDEHQPQRTLKRAPKLNRVWRKETATKTTPPAEKPKKIISVKKKLAQTLAKKKVKEKTKMLTAEQLELLKVIRLQAQTVDEKYKVLDARDKLLRSNIKKSRLKFSPTVGTCPDMCPEKERLLREIQHQVSMYEQDGTGRHCMDHSKAVKQYSRSSADQEAPLSHELRPVTVLQLTMTYLMYNIMDMSEDDSDVNIGEWFHFLWDRTRGIRKDITQQALCCQRSVELVEQCARFHIHCSARLMGEDPSVFDQKINTENLTKCLQTLKYMYHDLEIKGEKCPNEPEFRAYIILLNLSDGNFMWEVQGLRRDIQKSPEVKFALQIYSAFEKRNYVKFFKLIKSTTYLNACVLMRYFVQVRVKAIETLIKCFTPPKSISFYPVQELTDLMFFDDVETTIDFMKTYGIGLNKDGSSFMIERSSFFMPELPYVLERSICVERKRASSVGAIVKGKEMSPETYMEMQSHEVHNSFDKDGYLVEDEMFNEIELSIEERLLDEADSRESTPERKSIVTNIFAPKTQPPNISLKRTASPNIFQQQQPKKEPTNIFAQTKPDPASIFAQAKPDPLSIFGKSESVMQDTNIFAAAKKEIPDIFKTRDEVDVSSQKENIFARKAVANEEVDNFGKSDVFAKQNIFAADSHGNKDPRTQHPKTVFGTTEAHKNIFAQPEPAKPPAPPAKKGGFTFELIRPQKTTEVPNIFASGFKSSPDAETRKDKESNEAELHMLEQEKLRLQEEIRKEIEKEAEEQREQDDAKRRSEEIRRKNEEAAEKRRREAERLHQQEIERKQREQQEKLEREKRLEQEKIEREQSLREAKLKREQEEKQRLIELEKQRKELEEIEIQKTVKTIVTKMVEAVDLKIRKETLQRTRESMKRRFLIGICKKWRSIAVKRMKKRKALDCNPVFAHTKNVTQCAQDLHSRSQEMTLSNMKRYKYGRPLEIPLVKEPPIGQLNLFHLTYSSLRRRLCELKEKWHQHIYWKVVVSIPDVDEMLTGLHKLETTLKTYINWTLDKYGNTAYIEEHKTATYCVEKQQGFEVKNSDASAFVFVAKNFNDVMQRRVFENLKDFGVYVKLPVVLILEDTSNADEYLLNLRDTGIVSDYIIYSCNLGSHVLPSIIDNGLIFLSKGVEKYPPLELDTLYSFLMKHLCTEMWKKAASYAKWNHDYNFCMRDPNIVINLYNEGLELLREIITDKNCKEYAAFPDIFRDYLADKIPDFLPCDYRYFPNFWMNPGYEDRIKFVLKSLKLPKFLEKWPPQNETDLLISISKYCTEVFKNPKAPLIAILNSLKSGLEDDYFHKLIWTEAIQVIAQEKLKELDLSLPKDIVSDVFNTFIVVYDVNVLNNYCSTEWFYRNNPTIESFKKITSGKLEQEKEEALTISRQARKRAIETSIDQEDMLDVISKAESMLRCPKNVCLKSKSQIEQLNRSIQDLEESISVVKRMDEMKLFKRFLEK